MKSLHSITALSFLSLASIFSQAQAEETSAKCEGKTVCNLGHRGYHVLPPDNWDGKTPLPILMHFHGWGRQGPVPINHKFIGGATRKAGVLLIAPNGLGKTWSFWKPGSRDTDFAKAVLDDVEKNYPIIRDNLMVSGYSWGSSMAWRFACEAGNQVSILFGISGTLYNQSEICETGPVETRHVHGLKDTVMDFPYGPNGSDTGPVQLWLRTNGCDAGESKTTTWKTTQTFKRYQWDNCASDKSVTLDIHGGGHWIARGWLSKQLEELRLTPKPS